MNIQTINTVLLCFYFVFLSSCNQKESIEKSSPDISKLDISSDIEVFADWETGEWNSGLTSKKDGPTASFSIKGTNNSEVVSWYANGEIEEGYNSSIHGMEVVDLEGSKVLKVWSDGSNRDISKGKEWDPELPYSNRSEISWHRHISYWPGDKVYLTFNFKPGDGTWDFKSDPINKSWETIITQFKEFDSRPFFEIKLSNNGLNSNGKLNLFVKGNKITDTDQETFGSELIGEVDTDKWTTIKVFIKTTAKTNGAVKVWINGGDDQGNANFSYQGRTLIQPAPGNGSYTKIGHYGQVWNKKVTYFDNLHITKEINTSLVSWAWDTNN